MGGAKLGGSKFDDFSKTAKSVNLPHYVYCIIHLPRDKLIGWFGWAKLRMNHEQHVWETCTKVDPIDVMVPG